MEVWLAPIAGTRVLVPFRVSIPTPIGLGVLQATQFVSVPQPRAAADGPRRSDAACTAPHDPGTSQLSTACHGRARASQ